MAVQALGAFSYDGRWDRLHRDKAGELGAVAWDVEKSPLALQARERVARLARPGLEGRRLVQRERVVAPSGASGSFVSFAKVPVRPTGVDSTMSVVRLEGGARVSAGRLELVAAGDGLAFRVPEVCPDAAARGADRRPGHRPRRTRRERPERGAAMA